jgi:hypothetical protein
MLAPALTHIFCQDQRKREFYQLTEVANVIPILKKGSRKTTGLYLSPRRPGKDYPCKNLKLKFSIHCVREGIFEIHCVREAALLSVSCFFSSHMHFDCMIVVCRRTGRRGRSRTRPPPRPAWRAGNTTTSQGTRTNYSFSGYSLKRSELF